MTGGAPEVRADLRVLSFNVRAAISWDGLDSWPFRRRRFTEVLGRQGATVAAFQEVVWPVAGFLSRQLAAHSLVPGRPYGSRIYRSRLPILVERGALQLCAHGAFWISASPERWSRSWGSRQVRAATWAILSLRGRSFICLNLHLDHGPAPARDLAAALVLERLRGLGWPRRPAVVCGDFNCEPGGEVHRRFLEAGFHDSYQQAGLPDGPAAYTVHDFRGRRARHGRIDWILCSLPLRTVRAGIVRDSAGGRYPSDHYPVVADLAGLG